MAKRSPKKSGTRVKTALTIGAGAVLVAAAATAASGYFLYGTKTGIKKRKQMKGWMLKAKGEVLEGIENLKDINEQAYGKIVNTVMTKYSQVKDINPIELASMKKELKSHWKHIQKHIKRKEVKPKKRTSPRRRTASAKTKRKSSRS